MKEIRELEFFPKEEEPQNNLLLRNMGKRARNIIVHFALIFLSLGAFSQIANGPPQPGAQSQAVDGRKGPCGALPDKRGGTGNIPPPPGLCLPINDYLMPLLLCGIVLGSLQVYKLQKAHHNEISSED